MIFSQDPPNAGPGRENLKFSGFLALGLRPPDRQRLLLFLASAIAALYLGFIGVPVPTARLLIIHGGYYYILFVFAWFLYCSKEAVQPSRWRSRRWWRAQRWRLVAVGAGTGFAVWADPFQHKILFDEYVLQATAYHMHATKEVGTLLRAYYLEGTWLPIDSFLDKRPYFFAFLVSLLHDLTGYRIANIFVLNVGLTGLLLNCVYSLARAMSSTRGAVFAVLVLSTMPLLAQQTSGAGMEIHNLAMLALVICLAVRYLRLPTDSSLAVLVLGVVLLSQSRYESVGFVVSAAAVIILGWVRRRCPLLPWAVVAAPLLLVPYVWLNRVLSATPLLWQLGDGQKSRFALHYLPGNLAGAWKFFSNTTGNLANSWFLSLVGVAGIILYITRYLKRCGNSWSPAFTVVGWFGLVVAGNLGMLMFYYWSRLDDVIASRFALPLCLILALVAPLLLTFPGRVGLWTRRAVLGSFMVWVVAADLPVIARRLYTDQNLNMLEIEWQHEYIEKHQEDTLFITNSSTIPFILWKIPTIVMGVARSRTQEIAYHLQQGTFRQVFVAQALRATDPMGEMGIDNDDVLPPAFHLETIAIKRFGARWSRFSRLVGIDTPHGLAVPQVLAARAPSQAEAAHFAPAPRSEKTN